MQSYMLRNYYFLPKSKIELTPDIECLYFDEKFKHINTSPQKNSCYAVAIKIIASRDLGTRLPLKNKEGAVIRWVEEPVLGTIIKFSGEVKRIDPKKWIWNKTSNLLESETSHIMNQISKKFTSITHPILLPNTPNQSCDPLLIKSERQVRFDPKIEEKVTKRGLNRPQLQGSELLMQNLSTEISKLQQWKNGPSLNPKTIDFINYVIMSTLNDLSRDVIKGRLSIERAFSEIETRLTTNVPAWKEHTETILHEDFSGIEQLLKSSSSNIQELRKAFQDGGWKKGERKTIKHIELNEIELKCLIEGLSTILQEPSIKQGMQDYLRERIPENVSQK